MNKYSLLLLLALLSPALKAQTDKYYGIPLPEFAEKAKLYFDALKKEDYPFLVPYCENGKWGYLHKTSLKRITPAFAGYLSLYKENGYLGSVRDSATSQEYLFYLNEEGKIKFQVSVVAFAEAMPPPVYSRSFPQEIVKKSSKKGYKGFEYAEAAGYINITAYSDLYASSNSKTPLLIPLKINGKVYAVAGKKTKDPYITYYGIIDPRGKALKGFNFIHQQIRPVTGMRDTENVWFVVRDIADKQERYSYVNHKGKYLMKNELTQGVFNAYESSQKYFPYYEPKNTVFDYVVSDHAVFDLYEMKKMNIVPAGYRAMSIDYATMGVVKTEPVSEQRKKAHIYLWISKDQDSFYIDFDGKEYRPSE